MILSLNNLLKALIGKQAKANHPINICNPSEFFIISDVKMTENEKIAVRGENTIWFIGSMVEIIE